MTDKEGTSTILDVCVIKCFKLEKKKALINQLLVGNYNLFRRIVLFPSYSLYANIAVGNITIQNVL